MALISPATTADDVDRHTAAFRTAVTALFPTNESAGHTGRE
jgi:hypothetical protein